MPVEYPLTQLSQQCTTWKLPNYYHWEAITRHSRDKLDEF